MILVDTDIKELLNADKNSILNHYDVNHVTNIAYDLRTDGYYKFNRKKKSNSCALDPGESVYVRSLETVHLPNNVIARIVLRNSRIRQGLQLEAPVYQPGHITRIFFRITNISNNVISFDKESEIASIMFERLEHSPEHPYCGGFQNEESFADLGDYTSSYKSQMKAIEKKVEDAKHIERNMYGNVITLMIIFIGIFSLINVNINLAVSASSNLKQLLIFNLSTVGSIAFMTGLIHSIFLKQESGWRGVVIIWSVCAIAFTIAIILLRMK